MLSCGTTGWVALVTLQGGVMQTCLAVENLRVEFVSCWPRAQIYERNVKTCFLYSP